MNHLEEFIKNFEPEIENKPAFRFQLDKVILEIKQKAESSAQPITMRDYFAAKAMQAMANAICKIDDLGIISHAPNDIAQISYVYADSMMKARENDS
jgi:hypothetical protein